MPAFSSPRPLVWTLSILLAGMAGSMLLAGQWAWRHSLREESGSVQRQLALYGQALAQRIDRYRTLPEVLALDNQLRDALRHPLRPGEVERLNRKLEQANGASQSSTLTLIDREGRALAASNWRTATSNVGMDYSFRPYVQQALAGGSGSFYGIGVTTGEPGYFLSQAIRDEQGAVLGLVAIKIALQALEREWLQTPDIVLASDAHGVVFLATQDAWRYRLLRTLDDKERRELGATRQYADQPLQPLAHSVEERLDNGVQLVRVRAPAVPGRLLWLTQPFHGTPWQLHLVHDTHSSAAYSRWAAAAGGGGWLALALLVLFVRQRQRLSLLRQRSRQELETVLRQHAQELRVADRTRDLAEAKREAEKANRYKTRFVAAAVHDLLQPLNAARMFTSLLPGHLQDEAGRRVADGIDGALAAQDAILHSLLDISRMESGQLEVRVRDVALGPVLQVLGHHFGMLAGSRGLKLSCAPTRHVVRTDEDLLRRILQNFVSNAIRYSRRGRIVVGCRRAGDQLRIEVHDQGPGIPEALQREIFEEFRRLDEGRADDRGAGLGLAIVERLGRLLGHEIGLRSTLGRGSVFWVSVPLGDAAAVQRTAPPHAQQHQDDAPLHGSSAWVIEDDSHTCTATQALLERWGCTVPLAGGAMQALEQARPGQAPQLVLLDVRLEGCHHGPDVYAQLCRCWGQAPAVILVTAEPDARLRRQAAERGWGFLAKPVRAPSLRALVSQTLLRLRDGGGHAP